MGKPMKKIFFILIIAAQIIHSQNITGKLVDHNGNGLAEAELKLYIEPDVYNTTSESDGSFSFVITSVSEDQLPKGYSVSNNYPNPFNPKTRIEVTLANSGNVRLEVYNILGQLVTDVIDKKMNAGTHYIDLELAGNSNGVYIAKTTIDNKYSVINKMLLLYGSQHLITGNYNETSNHSFPKQVMSTLTNLRIDSLVIESKIIGRYVYTDLPEFTGEPLDLGSFEIERFCSDMPTIEYEGQIYNTVQIGNQCWLKENLNVGTRINRIQNQTNNSIIEKYCYNNDESNCDTYGGLYQWNEAMQYSTQESAKGICPNGWHIPTKAEFETLRSTVNDDGNALKSVGQGSGTNSSGFSALFAGYRHNDGNFYNLGSYPYFWSSTEINIYRAYGLFLYNNGSNSNLGYYNKEDGFSVRCVQD